MKAEDLSLDEIIDYQDGNLNLYGRRLTIHSMHAFAKFRKDIIDMIGWEHTRKLFTRFGFFWGQADAAGMKRIFNWNSVTELIKAGGRLHALQGVTPVSFDEFEYNPDTGRLLIRVTWSDSIEAEEHLTEIGWSREPICWKLVGYASGYASFCINKPVYFIEDNCRAKGDKVCTAIGKDIDSWGDEIKDYLKYYETDDIRAKIKELSKKLIEKENEFRLRAEKLVKLRSRMMPYFLDFKSKSLQHTFDLADRVAKFDSSIIITGETGVGKEILAHYIHANSHRSEGPFMAINCAALPESILESELFGHKAGSFTGATHDRVGLLELADQGTLFLDEIGDISASTQLKLLRVLEEKEIMRIGEDKPRKIDVRLISATNKNLDESVAKSEFREDLLYRLKVIELEIPPLRDRPEDILPLARYIISKLAKKLKLPDLKIDATAIDYLLAYSWPGNIRELTNVLERGAVLSKKGVIKPDCLPSNLVRDAAVFAPHDGHRLQTLKEIERKYIDYVMNSVNNNKTYAARILEISMSTLWRKLKE